jgi:hypothetical protein
MTDKEAMKLALDALETLMIERGSIYEKAIAALNARLTQPEQEPVAWQFMNGSSFRKRRPDDFSDLASDGLPYWRPLYTTPPQRTWVGLTDEEAKEVWKQLNYDFNHGKFAADDTERHVIVEFYRAIMKTLKEKNT